MLGKIYVLVFAVTLSLQGFIRPTYSAPIRDRNKSEAQAEDEAVKIALESTGELIPQPDMVEKIKSDLELIRYLDKSLEKRIHQGKWKPGQVVVQDVSEEKLGEVEKSEFKPVKSISKNGKDTILVFSKPYHPEQLSRLLQLRFEIDSKPNYEKNEDKQDVILYRDELSTYYWNSQNGKDCEEGCLAQYAVSINGDHAQRNDTNFYNFNTLT